MKERIVLYLLSALIEEIVNIATKPEIYKEMVDFLCDKAEEIAYRTDNKIDDKAVGRVCRAIRDQLNVPDDDEINPDALIDGTLSPE
jgi:hypothetical protein